MIAVNKQYRINKTATRRIVNESKTPCGVVFLFETSQKDNVMNIWTQKSIELATQRNYLNLLYRVYPMSVNLRRELSESTLNNIKIAFDSRDGNSLLKILLKQEMFPIKDSYVAYLKRDKTAIERNPNTVNRISSMLYEMGWSEILDKLTIPKETNRQIGPLFKKWIDLKYLGANITKDVNIFLNSTENIIFNASDAEMKEFAKKYLGYNRDKGLDFIAKFNKKFLIGEAKFLTDFGGHQNAQYEDAISTLRTPLSKTNYEVIKIAILDGVLYIKSNNKMYKNLSSFSDNEVIISAVLLRDYLYSI